MFNPPLIHWTATNAEVVESSESSSGFEVVLTNGTIAQELYQKVIANESYVVSFKAKGTELTLNVGGITKAIQLTENWARYVEKLSTTATGEFFTISNANCHLCEVQLERGTIATAWSRSFLDNSSDRAYYQAREYLDAAIKGFTDVYGGLILTGMIKVGTQANGVMTKETAGMNGRYLNDKDVAFWAGGSDVQAINAINQAGTNEANFAVSHGGKVVMNDAVVRGKVYASEGEFRGDIYADNGVFGGFIQKKVTMVNSANIDAIAPLEGGYRTLSPKTAGSLMYITDSIIGQITFSLPHLWKGRVYDISENEYTPTDVRAMVGNSITIYNESPNAIVRVCGYALSVGLQGQETMSLGCSVDGIANPKHYCHAECKLKKSDEGYEYIYWELHNGEFE